MLWLAVQHKLNTKDRLVKSPTITYSLSVHFSPLWYTMWWRIPNSSISCGLLDVVDWFTLRVKGKGFNFLVMSCVCYMDGKELQDFPR